MNKRELVSRETSRFCVGRIRSDEGLTLVTPINIINCVDKTKFSLNEQIECRQIIEILLV